jgi:hypothetical protein
MTRHAPKKKTTELAALEQAGKKAVELARRTGTPAYAIVGDKIVDSAKPTRRQRKKSA